MPDPVFIRPPDTLTAPYLSPADRAGLKGSTVTTGRMVAISTKCTISSGALPGCHTTVSSMAPPISTRV